MAQLHWKDGKRWLDEPDDLEAIHWPSVAVIALCALAIGWLWW